MAFKEPTMAVRLRTRACSSSSLVDQPSALPQGTMQLTLPFPTDWDSLDHHKQFIASPIYGPFAKHLMTIVDGTLTMLHANFAPHPPTAALGTISPVTEVLTFYFEKENDGFDSKLRQFIKVISENAEGFKAASGGWVIEDVEYKGKKGKAYVAILGWESVKAHMNFRETQAFKENINIVRADPLGMEVHHTEFVAR